MTEAEILEKAREIDQGKSNQIVRITFRFINYNMYEYHDSITSLFEGFFAIIPGWNLNNVIFPIVNGKRVCRIIMVRT